MSHSAELPPQDVLTRRREVLHEHIYGQREAFAHCPLSLREAELPENETLWFNEMAALYLVDDELSPTGRTLQYMHVKSQDDPLSSQAVRRLLMECEVAEEFADLPTDVRAAWQDEEIQGALLDTVAAEVNPDDSPLAFVAIGTAEKDGRTVVVMHHHPYLPATGALELLQHAADDTIVDLLDPSGE